MKPLHKSPFFSVFVFVAVVGALFLWLKFGQKTPDSRALLNAPAVQEEVLSQPDTVPATVSTPPAAAGDTRGQTKPIVAHESFSSRNSLYDKGDKTFFDETYPVVENMQRGKRGGLFGYINMQSGRIVGWYDEAEDFRQGRARVKKGGRTFVIDPGGKCLEGCQ